MIRKPLLAGRHLIILNRSSRQRVRSKTGVSWLIVEVIANVENYQILERSALVLDNKTPSF